jgi:predicted Zn-ribbon and HTH transcriptional regulator
MSDNFDQLIAAKQLKLAKISRELADLRQQKQTASRQELLLQDDGNAFLCKCLRFRKQVGKPCGHRWLKRTTDRPKQCPQCKSQIWDKPVLSAARSSTVPEERW